MPVHLIDSHDAAAFDDWFSVLQATDADQTRWGDHRAVKAMADLRDGAVAFHCLAATDGAGAPVGIGALQVPMRDNRRRVTVDVRVLPSHRRRGIGSSIVAEVERWAAGAGRRVLQGEAEVPAAAAATDASAPFARQHGFVVVQRAHRRHLALPVPPHRLDPLRAEAVRATAGYTLRAFTTPWPEDALEDYCEFQRRMSTDAPAGDADHEEESWDAARVRELDDLLAAQGLVKVAAVAEHAASGRPVAFSEIAVVASRTEGWQWATLVLGPHRGHRLGLAVKLANLDYLRATFPTVGLVITANAEENGPMVAVNEVLGFTVAADQTIWEKHLGPPT